MENDRHVRPTDDECVIHDHPVPPEELGRYSIERDLHSERDIASYVEGQAPDETVQHVERIKKEVVVGGRLRDLGRNYGQRSLVGHNESDKPLFPEAFPEP